MYRFTSVRLYNTSVQWSYTNFSETNLASKKARQPFPPPGGLALKTIHWLLCMVMMGDRPGDKGNMDTRGHSPDGKFNNNDYYSMPRYLCKQDNMVSVFESFAFFWY